MSEMCGWLCRPRRACVASRALALNPSNPSLCVKTNTPSMRTRVPSFGQTFPNKVGPWQKKQNLGKPAQL